MKQIISLIIFLTIALSSFTQSNDPVRLRALLENAKEDTAKVSYLLNLSSQYENVNLDSAMLFAHQGYELSKKLNDVKKEAESLKAVGILYMKKDNYFFGLQTEINALKLFERLNDQKGIAEVNFATANIFERLGDHHQAVNSLIRCKVRASSINDSTLLMNSYSSLAYNHYKLGEEDSAAKYAQLAFDMARTQKNNTEQLPWTIALMGVVQQEMGNSAIAMAYYYDAVGKAKLYNQKGVFPYLYQVMAELYKQTSLTDSAILYGERALHESRELKFSKGIADASVFLANLYSDHDKEKAVDYFLLSEQLRDSIFSLQKINQIQNVAYTEEIRQRDIEKSVAMEAEERKKNIQYAALIIGIIFFLILFLMLSHSVIVNAKVVSYLGVLALLVVFEFINLILHPYLEVITHHSPPLMLLALVLVGALLVPAHHYLQKWINHTLVSKNNKIRLAAAKRIIAELETREVVK